MPFIAELGDSEKSENNNQKNRMVGIIRESEEMYVAIHIFWENRKNRVVLGESEKSENRVELEKSEKSENNNRKNRIIGKIEESCRNRRIRIIGESEELYVTIHILLFSIIALFWRRETLLENMERSGVKERIHEPTQWFCSMITTCIYIDP